MASTLRLPTGSVGDREVSNNEGDQINESKLWHLYDDSTNFNFDIADVPVVVEVPLFTAIGAGTILKVEAGLWDSGTSTDIDVDLKKNGTTMLTGDINIVHGTGDKTPVAGVFSDGGYVAGDVISAAIDTVTASTGALGPYLTCRREEMGD